MAQGNFESVKDEVMGEASVGSQSHQMDVEEHPTQDQRKTSEQMKENEPESVSLREEKEDQEIGNVSFKVYKDFFHVWSSSICSVTGDVSILFRTR